MSHELTNTDGLVLHANAAWHGLGKVVETAPSPGQALTLAGLDWQVEEGSLHGSFDDDKVMPEIESHKALLRSDNGDIFSVVGTNYQALQNDELAEFCYALADEGDVQVESAGSLKGGKRVWFLLKSDTLCIGDTCDEVEPYVLCFNSHDGSSSVEFMPTTVRVVCNNTLTWARKEKRGSGQAFRFRHTKNMKSYIKSATNEMRECFLDIEKWNERMNELAQSEITHDQLDAYFYRAYEKIQGKVPTVGTQLIEGVGKMDAAKQRKQREVIADWHVTFHSEREHHGLKPSKWLAVNAVTNWIDHQSRVVKSVRSDHKTVDEARAWSNLFGGNAVKKSKALALAQSMK